MVVSYPNQTRNYCTFSPEVNERVKNGTLEIPVIKRSLENPTSESEVIEDLFILNSMIDEGVPAEEVAKLYPTLSKYNQTTSPNIQTYLAGIYRKTKVPDAFGPLIAMLIKNSINAVEAGQNNKSDNSFKPSFTPDPNEEIGGAILDYLA